MRTRSNPYQRSLELKVIVREPTIEDLRAAYEACILNKDRLPFEKALALREYALPIKNAARAAIIRRGGK